MILVIFVHFSLVTVALVIRTYVNFTCSLRCKQGCCHSEESSVHQGGTSVVLSNSSGRVCGWEACQGSARVTGAFDSFLTSELEIHGPFLGRSPSQPGNSQQATRQINQPIVTYWKHAITVWEIYAGGH